MDMWDEHVSGFNLKIFVSVIVFCEQVEVFFVMELELGLQEEVAWS